MPLNITQTVAPPNINVSAEPMSPTVFVGFTLARFVLWITAGSIVLLLLYLFAMEFVIGSDVRNAYEKVLNPNRIMVELQTVAELEKFAGDLGDARRNPTAQWSNESQQNAQKIIKLIQQLPSVTEDQKARLGNCVPPALPSDATRDSKLDSCLG